MAAFVELNDLPCEDVNELAERCAKPSVNLPTDWVGEANRYICTIGLAPGLGGALVRKSVLDKIDLTDVVSLRLGDGMGGVREFSTLRAIGSPRCIDAGTKDPVYLVRLSDRRCDLTNVVSTRSNWRYHPTDVLVSLNTDVTKTYETVGQALWELLPDLGDWPGLPSGVTTPTAETIDRLDVHGYRVVDALEDVLAAVGCAAVYDPFDDSFSIAYLPTATDKAVDVFRNIRGKLKYDESPYTPPNLGPVPAKVVVLFPVWNGGRYGREPNAMYAREVARPSSGDGVFWASGATMSTSVVYLQDFTPCRVWANNNVANTTLLGLRAAQVSRIFYDRFTANAPQWPIKRAYFGIVDHDDLIPGASFDLVGWSVGTSGAITIVSRADLNGQAELYDPPALSGILSSGFVDSGGDPPVLTKTSRGAVSRVGGYRLEPEHEWAAMGWSGGPGGKLSIAGAGLGPLIRRGTALRQGEWTSIGSGGRTDQRGRLWRNWEDHAPDDMERFLLVTGPVESINMQGTAVNAYPATPMKQDGAPVDWFVEEDCWLLEVNGDTLVEDRGYLARMGTINDDDGKYVWATFCCDSVANIPPGGGGCGGGCDDEVIIITSCCVPTGVPSTIYAHFNGTDTAALNYIGPTVACGTIPADGVASGWCGLLTLTARAETSVWLWITCERGASGWRLTYDCTVGSSGAVDAGSITCNPFSASATLFCGFTPFVVTFTE